MLTVSPIWNTSYAETNSEWVTDTLLRPLTSRLKGFLMTD